MKHQKEGMDAVEIASSDDEGGVGVNGRKSQRVQTDQVGQRYMSRSFWKAGAYDITPINITPAPGFIPSLFIS